MPLTITCPNASCRTQLKVPDEVAGRAVKCPKCSTVFKAEAPAAGAPASAPAPAPAPKPAAPAAAKPAAPAAGTKPAAAPAPTKPAAAPAKPGAAPAAKPAAAKPAAAKPAADSVAPGAKLAPAAKAPAARPAADKGAVTKKPAPPAEDDVAPLEDMDEADADAVTDKPIRKNRPEKDDKGDAGGRGDLEVDKSDPWAGQDVPDQYRKDIEGEFTKGERVRWVGRPDLQVRLKKAFIALPIGVVLGLAGFVLVVLGCLNVVGVMGDGTAGPMIAFSVGGLFLMLFSIPCMLAQWLTRKFANKREVFVITNRRCVLYSGRSLGQVQMRAWTAIQCRNLERKDSSFFKGVGNLIFEYTLETKHEHATANRPARTYTVKVPHGFTDVADVRKVEKFIRESLIDKVTDKLLSDEPLPRAKRKDDEEELVETEDLVETEEASDDPNVKTAPGVAARKKASDDADEDPNVKPAPGARAGKKGAAAEEDPNLKSAPGTRPAKKAKGGDEGDEEAADEDPNVRTRDRKPEQIDSEEVPGALVGLVENELSAREKILWIGQPNTKLAFLRGIFPALGAAFFGLVFGCVFSCAGGATASTPGGGMGYLFMALGGLAGLGCFVGAIVYPFYRRWLATKSVYAVTNRRCLVFQANFMGKPQLTGYGPENLTNMRRADSWLMKGGGDLIFSTRTVITTTYNRRGGSSVSSKTYYYGFLCLKDPRPVEVLIRETLVDPLLDRLTD